MKPVLVGTIALLVLVGVSLAQFANTAGGGGGFAYPLLALVGFFVIIFALRNRSRFSGNTFVVYGDQTGTPTVSSG